MGIEHSEKNTQKQSFLTLILENTKSEKSLSLCSFYGYVTIGELDNSESLQISINQTPTFFKHCVKIIKFFSTNSFEEKKTVDLFKFAEYNIIYELNQNNNEKYVSFIKRKHNENSFCLFELKMLNFGKLLKAFELSFLSTLNLSLEEKLIIENLLKENEDIFKTFKNDRIQLYSKILSYIKVFNLNEKNVSCVAEIFLFYFDIFEVLLKLKSLPDV